MTIRLEQAIKKLYTAFHTKTLNPECCINCAVGNILDNKDSWKHLSDNHGSTNLNYVGKVNEMLGKRFNGYSPTELLNIEIAFLKGCGYELPLHKNTKVKASSLTQDQLFNGLSSTITYLCKLDKIDNVMDYSNAIDLSLKQSVQNAMVEVG